MTEQESVWRELEEDRKNPEYVADLLGVDSSTVYRWLNSGRLGGVRLGKKWWITESDVRVFLDEERKRQMGRRSLDPCPLCGRPPTCPSCETPLDT